MMSKRLALRRGRRLAGFWTDMLAAWDPTAKPSLQARIATVVTTQLKMHTDTIANFRSPNMPWPGDQCVSKWAGISGLAYSLPALVSPSGWEQGLWILSAFLSVKADYVHIHEDSIFHGLDRCYATLIMVRGLFLGSMYLEPWNLVLAIVPIMCFIKGRDAKALPEPSSWMFWHTLWHLSGGLLVLFGTWQMHAVQSNALSRSSTGVAWAMQAVAASDGIFAPACSPIEIQM